MDIIRSDDIRVSPTEARNLLIVIAALIATVTFQVGVNPPGGVWQESTEDGRIAGTAIFAPIKKNSTAATTSSTAATAPTSSITDSTTTNTGFFAKLRSYNSQEATYFLFLIGNTLALSTSVTMMLFLTHKFPLRLPTYVATICMFITYFASIYAITPDTYADETALAFVGLLPSLMYAAYVVYHFIQAENRNLIIRDLFSWR